MLPTVTPRPYFPLEIVQSDVSRSRLLPLFLLVSAISQGKDAALEVLARFVITQGTPLP